MHAQQQQLPRSLYPLVHDSQELPTAGKEQLPISPWGRLTSGNLQAKQWWSTVKQAAGDKRRQDGISAHVLKACASQLALPLSRRFSLCFRSGIQPSSWKVVKVVPIHKKKSRSALSNYRPISLLTILSKMMETIVNRSVTNFLERNSILPPFQFGFRGALSTADLLTKLHHQWSKSLASGGAVHVLAIDIAGAFDKVSHSGILHKAKYYSISGPLLTWL